MSIIENQNLFIREFMEEDIDDISDLLQLPANLRYYEQPFSNERVQAWLDSQLVEYGNEGYGLWAIVDKKTRITLGSCGLTFFQLDDIQGINLEYRVNHEFLEDNMLLEALHLCVIYIKEILKKEVLYFIEYEQNEVSEQLKQKYKMKRCSEFKKKYTQQEILHQVYCINF